MWSAAADQRINVERLRDWLTGKEGRRATTQEPPQDVAVAGHFQTVSEDIGSCDATAVAQRRETEFGVVATIVAGVATNNAVATVEVDPQVKKSITGNQRSNSKKLRREKPR